MCSKVVAVRLAQTFKARKLACTVSLSSRDCKRKIFVVFPKKSWVEVKVCESEMLVV